MNKTLLAMLTATACATAVAKTGYLSDTDEPRGWHFYAEEVKDKPEQPQFRPPPPSQSSPVQSQHKPLSSKWLKEHFINFVYEAIDNPSPANIQRARYLQRVIMDKSSQFSEAWMQDVINNPYLDETQARATSRFALDAKSESLLAAEKTVMSKIGEKAGLWFFFQSTCDYCKRQAPIVEMLMQQYGLNANAISIDLAPFPDGRFPDYSPDFKGIHRELGVQRVPALYLVANDSSFIAPISQGIMTADEIKRIMMIQAKTANIITQQDMDAASPVESMERLASFEGIDEERALSDANYLVELLESRLRQQSQ
ncbi:conjugal transfer protein TraF [Vibrio sp. SCSIO 43140]|uniref:conjugal transfer protein TraF n=1 Tax=Vibrio sp. SCSIO 43140 TaxID=2819100 RepID=UPI002076553C|nr:conjugal transfer protein TraF [Vibrio sp. SCSIO 43140]USD58920.1 conjugal transfer protein TraF [Vibrio sp. SCSIO 43140]